jgi:hypothetical protein
LCVAQLRQIHVKVRGLTQRLINLLETCPA